MKFTIFSRKIDIMKAGLNSMEFQLSSQHVQPNVKRAKRSTKQDVFEMESKICDTEPSLLYSIYVHLLL